MNKKYLITVLVGITVVLVGIYLLTSNSESPSDSANETEATETPLLTPIPILTPTTPQIPPIIVSKNLPQCSIGGQIKYVKPNIYLNEDNFLTYSNIRDSAQLIKWTVTPSDEVRIGPNIFSHIPRPDGEELISATFYSPPEHGEYTITAKVTYFEVVNRIEEVSEIDCSGKTTIKINY